MYIKDIIDEMESLAPLNLKEDFDNVGLMVGDRENKATKVLLALDCTKDVIDEAIDKGCNLIITHHPLIFRKIDRITKGTLIGDKIIKLIKNDIAVYSSHTNLDSTKDGINSKIVEMLGLGKGEIMDSNGEETGIGRVVRLENQIKTKDLIEKIKKVLKVEVIKGYVAKESVKTVAVINGSGTSFFKQAYSMGADCIITGDTSYHFLSDYKEEGVTILDAGHFGTEWIVFLEVMKEIEKKLKEVEFIASEKSENPYSFF